MDKMPSHLRVAVEGELKKYPAYKNMLSTMKDHIVHQGNRAMSGMPKPKNPSTPTENKAFQLVTEKKIAHLEFVCESVEEVFKDLVEEEQLFVELRYFNGDYTDQGVIRKMNLSRNAYYQMKKEVLHRFAYVRTIWYTF